MRTKPSRAASMLLEKTTKSAAAKLTAAPANSHRMEIPAWNFSWCASIWPSTKNLTSIGENHVTEWPGIGVNKFENLAKKAHRIAVCPKGDHPVEAFSEKREHWGLRNRLCMWGGVSNTPYQGGSELGTDGIAETPGSKSGLQKSVRRMLLCV